MKSLYLLLVIIFLSGCKPILKTVYGIKKPRVEDEKSLKKYLVKKDIDTLNVYVFKNIMAFATASQNNLLAIPDAMFFNKAGNLVPYKETATSCNANADKFLKDLQSFADAPVDTTKTIKEVFELLEPQRADSRSDVNVVITWSKYAGRLNKTKAFEWIELIEDAQKKGVDISYYLVNCDFQKSWNISEAQKNSMGIKN